MLTTSAHAVSCNNTFAGSVESLSVKINTLENRTRYYVVLIKTSKILLVSGPDLARMERIKGLRPLDLYVKMYNPKMYVFRIICYSIRKHELIRESATLLNTCVHQTVFNWKTKIFMYLNTTITCWNFETKIIYNSYVYMLSFYFTNNSFLISLTILCEDVNVWKRPWGGGNITWKKMYIVYQ